MPEIEELIEEDISTSTIEDIMDETLETNKLVLFNDEDNSFEHVIDCLCKYLDMDNLQAEQIAMIVHMKGKCILKDGTFDELKPFYEALHDNKLVVEIQ